MNETLLDNDAVPPPVLLVAAIRLITLDADECNALEVIAEVADVCWNNEDWEVFSAFEVIREVFEVNCNPCVTTIEPALLLQLIPFEFANDKVWNVEDAFEPDHACPLWVVRNIVVWEVCSNKEDWDVFNAFDVIADVLDVCCNPWVIEICWPVVEAQLIPFPSLKVTEPDV